MRYLLFTVPLVCLLLTAAEAQYPAGTVPNSAVSGRYGTVPGPPTAPAAASRSPNWPGGDASGEHSPSGSYDTSGDYAPAGAPEPGETSAPPPAAHYPTTSAGGSYAPPAARYPTTAASPRPAPPASEHRATAGTPYPPVSPPPYPATSPAPPQSQTAPYGPAYAGRAAPPSGPTPAGPPAAAASGGLEIYEGARKLAQVGSEVILAADLMAGLSQLVEANKDRMPADELRKQIDAELKRRLDRAIEVKLLWLDAKRTIPEEAYAHLERRVVEHFETKEVPSLMERAKADSRVELDAMLREMGSSLDKRKRDFLQMAVAQEWLRQQSKDQSDVTLDQIRAYYEAHAEDFDHAGRARWEELTVRFADHPNKAEAHAKIAWLGNQVLAGHPLAEVAKTHSEGSTAAEGGQWDWTTQGSLASEELDRAIFGLPVGHLSPIIETDRGYHIVRVVEREEAHRTPFAEAQAEIRKKLKEEGRQEKAEAFVARLKEEIPVWTVYDSPAGTSADAGNYPYR